MKTQEASQRNVSQSALATGVIKLLQLCVLAIGIALVLPSFAFAQGDTDLGQVEKITPNDRDESQNPDMVNYYQNSKGALWHLWKRPDGTYYLKGKGVKGGYIRGKGKNGDWKDLRHPR